jgi:hypothetical protein
VFPSACQTPGEPLRRARITVAHTVSPALANCALDGLERLLKEKYPKGRRLKSLKGIRPCVNLIRYADDFVITGKSKELLEEEVKPLVEQFLQERGLELFSIRRQCCMADAPMPRGFGASPSAVGYAGW